MKILVYILLILFISQETFSQKIWIKKDVGHNIDVRFPQEPKHESVTGNVSYVSKSKDCLFMLLIRYNQLPNYKEFLKLPKEQQVKLEYIFLNKVIEGKTSYNTNHLIFKKNIAVGRYRGVLCGYKAVNPADGKENIRFSKTLLVNDELYIFDCWYLTSSENSVFEKDKFLNSIAISTDKTSTLPNSNGKSSKIQSSKLNSTLDNNWGFKSFKFGSDKSFYNGQFTIVENGAAEKCLVEVDEKIGDIPVRQVELFFVNKKLAKVVAIVDQKYNSNLKEACISAFGIFNGSKKAQDYCSSCNVEYYWVGNKTKLTHQYYAGVLNFSEPQLKLIFEINDYSELVQKAINSKYNSDSF